MEKELLVVDNLTKEFKIKGKRSLTAVSDVSFNLTEGESVAVVGESGCGKSTLARLISRIEKPTSGRVLFEGLDLSGLSNKQLLRHRQKIQMVFQHPAEAISTRMTLGDFLKVPLKNFNIVENGRIDPETERLLDMVGLPVSYKNKYAYEVSGGELQRIIIARAMAARPKLLLLDEPTSALDVSIQQDILELLIRLKEEQKMACLFITHDLSLVSRMTSRVMVMYHGQIVEELSSVDIKHGCVHPYSRFLLSSVFSVREGRNQKIHVLKDDETANISEGCPFAGRCPEAQKICFEKCPQLRECQDEKGHYTACHIISQSFRS